MISFLVVQRLLAKLKFCFKHFLKNYEITDKGIVTRVFNYTIIGVIEMFGSG